MKILWSIDAFETDADLWKTTVASLQALAERTSLEVHPVFVLNPDQLGLVSDFSTPWTQKYEPASKKALTERLKEISLPGMREPRVLTQPRASLTAAVETLLQEADRNGFDLIVASTHGRRGWERAMLGSFAETLLLRSKVPLMLVNPRARPIPAGAAGLEICYPSSLAEERSPFSQSVFRWTRLLKGRLTLLSILTRPIEPLVQSGLFLLSGAWVSFPEFADDEQMRRERRAEALRLEAKSAQVPVQCRVVKGTGPLAESIVTQANDMGSHLIFIEAEAGPVETALVGSVTREVVRTASCPVWVGR